MLSSQHRKMLVAVCVATSSLFSTSLNRTAHAQGAKPSTDTTNMTVVVKEYDTGEPISQARVTLEFGVPHGQLIPNRKPKQIIYNGKTDAQGRCKFVEVNKGPIVLSINAAGHQTYGKELSLEKDNQVFEIKLKKPQPLT
jgi:hypothetical protein